MKRSFTILLATLLLAGAAFGQAAPKVLVVDMASLLREYYKAREAFDKFESSVQSANEQLKTMRDEIQTILQPVPDLQARRDNKNKQFSDEAVQDAMKKLQEIQADVNTRQQALVEYQQKTQELLSQREQQIISLYVKEIRDVVGDYAQTKGIDVVLNAANVVYTKDAFDGTKAVLAILNADAPAAPAATPAKP